MGLAQLPIHTNIYHTPQLVGNCSRPLNLEYCFCTGDTYCTIYIIIHITVLFIHRLWLRGAIHARWWMDFSWTIREWWTFLSKVPHCSLRPHSHFCIQKHVCYYIYPTGILVFFLHCLVKFCDNAVLLCLLCDDALLLLCLFWASAVLPLFVL